MLKKEKYQRLLSYFTEHFPEPETELHYSNPYELIVAVILSAQCTDKRINLVTPRLFGQYPDVFTLSKATAEEVFDYIRSVSYPNNKSKHLVGMAQKVVAEFAGEIPGDINHLQSLPGVGRKTANVVASVIYNQPAMAVDTHVFRVSHRIGLVSKSATTPLAVEKELVRFIPSELIPKAHHWLILHGRYICLARSPKCSSCNLRELCNYYSTTNRNKKAVPIQPIKA